MKNPLEVKPVTKAPALRYPRLGEAPELAELLRKSKRALFSPFTLAFSGLLALSTARAADEEKPKPQPVEIDPQKVKDYIKQILQGEEGAYWEENGLDFLEEKVLDANPDIQVATANISFGNSRTAMDIDKARAALTGLFELYGLDLKENVAVGNDKVKFSADQFDASRNIGFEIVKDADTYSFEGGNPVPAETKNTEQTLVLSEEGETLNSMIKDGKISMLVVPVSKMHTYDGQYCGLKALLQSAVAYLEWLRKEGKL